MSFHINPALESEWAESDDGDRTLRAVAEKIAAAAKEIAPVQTGAYRDSIEVQVDGDAGPGVHVVANDFKAGWVEFGTEDTQAFAPLRKGAESAGLTLKAHKVVR